MTEFTRTDGGVRIAFDRERPAEPAGAPPLVLIGGAGQFRAVDPGTRALTTELAARGLDVVHYDRPGRGDSEGAPPFTLDGEVEALRALVETVGGRAALYGSSSGGAIALAAAGALPGVERLVLWEVPLGPEQGGDGAEFLAAVRERVDAGDPEDTLRTFMRGMPPEWFEGMRRGPQWPLFARMAPTVQADAEALAWTQSAPRADLWGGIKAPTTVLLGTSAFAFFTEAADSIVAAVPTADRAEVPGADHGWSPADLADVLAGLLSPRSP